MSLPDKSKGEEKLNPSTRFDRWDPFDRCDRYGFLLERTENDRLFNFHDLKYEVREMEGDRAKTK
ncbi:MAG: hypothetical protein IPF95_09475 [Flavobacteriales bacterium]|nr:hypothetical protein [Flavobacteriales bacterium]MBK6943331.1 hypothetical protein [Flavobacteriales bacterium]MBK7296592.1 hypothetical protein [Flavobacteriales bacterium]HQV53579.1 hypothetical protein [Flavobacteriales bacterium]